MGPLCMPILNKSLLSLQTMLRNQRTVLLFFLIIQWLQHGICQCWWHQTSLEADVALSFCRSQNKDICILSETNINQEQTHQIRNTWLVPIFFFPGDTHSKGMLVLLHLLFDEITKTDTDPKGRFVSFKVTSSNNRVLSIYAPSGHSIREQLTWGHFFGGEKTCMEKKPREMKAKF